jgi:hypothetical protein
MIFSENEIMPAKQNGAGAPAPLMILNRWNDQPLVMSGGA